MSKRTYWTALAIGLLLLFVVLSGAGSQTNDAASYVHTDQDNNGIPDDLEYRLANEFAPILFYDADEPNLPTTVERFLGKTELWYFSEYCSPQQVLISKT